MRYTQQQHVEYLNRFLETLWRASRGVVRDHLIHGIASQLPPVVRPLSASSAPLTAPPRLSLAPHGLDLALPGDEAHVVRLHLAHDIKATASFAVSLRVTASADPTSEAEVGVDLDIPWYAYVACGAAGMVVTNPIVGTVAGAVALHLLIECAIEPAIEAQIAGSDMTEHFTALSTLRYEPRGAAWPAAGVALQRVGPVPNGVTLGGEPDWLDIVFVADGFAAADLGEFSTATAKFAQALVDPGRLDNARLRAAATSMRLWRLPLEGGAPAQLRGRRGLLSGL